MTNIHQRKTVLLLLLTTFILTIIGLIFIYSSSSVFAYEQLGQSHYFLGKQTLGVLLGILIMLMVGKLPWTVIYHLTPLMWLGTAAACGLLVVYPACATKIHGSARWINLYLFSLQPSEFLKVTTILFLARMMGSPQFTQRPFVRSIIPVLLCSGITTILLLLQPDFGQTALILMTTCALFAVAYSNLMYLGIMGCILSLGGIALIIAKPYRLKRIVTFLHPWQDPRGAGFQVIQSLIAIGSGGLTGVGIGQSQQKFFYLPMQHTDFIFSIIAEETGFIGALTIIILYAAFLYCGIKLAWNTRNVTISLTIFSYVFMISCQAIINLAVTTGLAPTKGIGLPFVSYGISSLLAHSIMLGIIIAGTRADST